VAISPHPRPFSRGEKGAKPLAPWERGRGEGVGLARALATALSGLVLCSVLHDGVAQPVAKADARPGRDWAVDPTTAGENLPPVGRSLFDFVFVRNQGERKVYDIPFPFSAVVKKLEAELQSEVPGASPVKTVLIPLGRSLQRTAAAPEFFAYPRVVLGADTEPRNSPAHAGMLLKDRIFLGYQEKSDVIEVISYNEAAGRFEFQVVKDYRAGGVPKVFYANRTICMSCHQNAAPIFPRQLWDETNANRGIAAALVKEKRVFYGIEPDRGVDIPYALDNATDRANLLAAYQLLWRDGCEVAANREASARCRAALFVAALQYRLSGRQQFDRAEMRFRDHVLPVFARNAREYWPSGLRIPNADLPNRDPLILPVSAPGTRLQQTSGEAYSMAENVNVQAAFDPLVPRDPSQVWQIADAVSVTRLVAGLAEFIAESDVRRLSTHLSRQARAAKDARIAYESECEIRRSRRSANAYRIDFQCSADRTVAARAILQGRLYVEGRSAVRGSVDRVVLTDQAQSTSELRDLDVAAPALVTGQGRTHATLQLMRAGTHARRGDGNALETVEIAWDDAAAKAEPGAAVKGRATITVVQDFAPMHAIVEAMIHDTTAGKLDVFSNTAFRRASLIPVLFDRSGMKPLAWCCVSDSGMPAAVMDGDASPAKARADVDAKPVALQPFFRYCATCHQSNDRTPPNFLQGSANAVAANLAHCAQRLHVRLAMWQLPLEQRPKTPMPPPYALYAFHSSPQVWRDGAELAALRSYVERVLQAESGKAPRPEELMSRGYENLRACLPEAN